MLNNLSFPHDKSNRCSEASAERSGSMSIAYSNTNIARTITVDEWLAVIGAFGKETPASIYHRVSSWKNDVYLWTTEQFGNHTECDTCDKVAKTIDVENVRIHTCPMPYRIPNIYSLQCYGIYLCAKFI